MNTITLPGGSPDALTPEYPGQHEDITQHEIDALKTRFNLADAHTHQRQSPTQKQIVSNLDQLWYRAEQRTQYAAERDFIQAFYTLHGQHTALQRADDIYLVYAASIGMQITATYLMKNKLRVGLIEPCFDNLHDLMKHMQVPMQPLDESLFMETASIYENLMKHALTLDAIVLVDPNNPTGFSLFADGTKSFMELVRFCCDFNKILILDFSFASFILASGGKRPDVYQVLENSGVRYIAMEDTGKTWPLQDAKCSTILTSGDLNDEIYPIVTSVLLNVSPFILSLVTAYVEDSMQDGFASVGTLLDENRAVAIRHLDKGILKYQTPLIRTSVAWFEIQDPAVSADDVQNFLLGHQIYVLPGQYFYWKNPARGQRFIRVALAREQALFAEAMERMEAALNELG